MLASGVLWRVVLSFGVFAVIMIVLHDHPQAKLPRDVIAIQEDRERMIATDAARTHGRNALSVRSFSRPDLSGPIYRV
jgi:hypothetical protein